MTSELSAESVLGTERVLMTYLLRIKTVVCFIVTRGRHLLFSKHNGFEVKSKVEALGMENWNGDDDLESILAAHDERKDEAHLQA